MTQPPNLDLSDEAFLATFDQAGFDRHSFPHRAHLRLAWLCVRRLGVERAVERVTSGIHSIAEKHGQASRYHDTLTRAWVYAVAAADAERPDLPTFDRFLDAHPELLDKNYLLRHYSAQRLSSPEARARWLSPDLQPIPGAPPAGLDEGGYGAPIPALPAHEVRQALERVPLPIAVMTARDATRVHGTTVSSVVTAARDPALLVACVRHNSRILPIVRAAGGFALSYLGADQRAIATRFADRARGEDVIQFGGIPHVLGPFGAPIVTGGPAWFECRLQDEFEAADHQVVCGRVVAAGTTDARPLQRLQGGWV
jgi:flavin reductase (DIM6/NTAB) family NADH-FMN oxidoreductase RutF